MTTVRTASSDAELAQILALQRRYHVKSLLPGEREAGGFVFAEHTLPVLRRRPGVRGPGVPRQRLISRLYDPVRQSVPPDYDLCVTEIAARNQVSIRAHERAGFERVSTYADDEEEWVIVAWDLRRATRAP